MIFKSWESWMFSTRVEGAVLVSFSGRTKLSTLICQPNWGTKAFNSSMFRLVNSASWDLVIDLKEDLTTWKMNCLIAASKSGTTSVKNRLEDNVCQNSGNRALSSWDPSFIKTAIWSLLWTIKKNKLNLNLN